MGAKTRFVLGSAAIVLAAAACSDGTGDGNGGSETGIEKEVLVEKTPVQTDEADGDPMLRSWKLEAFGSAADLGDEATAAVIEGPLASLPADNPVTLGLREEGRVEGFDGCNRYFGEFRIENGHQIVKGPIGATLMACPGGAMELEQAILRTLEGATRAFVRGDRLELENDAGVVLVFAPWESIE
jgi:heat shock protein HslJ